jgi:hypothetical protein
MEILCGHTIRTSLTLIALTVFYFGAVKPLQVDILRQNLFEIRDALFDFAADNGISFQHPAYRGLRQEINNFIRFADKITFSRLVLTALFWTEEIQPPGWLSAMDVLPPLARHRLIQTRRETAEAIIHHMIYYSPIMMAIYWIVILRTIWDEKVHKRLLHVAESFEEQAREEEVVAA